MPNAMQLEGIARNEMDLSRDLYDVELQKKYNELRQTVAEHFSDRVWLMTEAALSVLVSCLLEDTVNPIALIFLDGPASEKTTVLDFFEEISMSCRIDKFTPASFLTQSANVRGKDLSKIDLLPKIVYKTMLIPEMGPTFNQPKEMLMENYAILARILDGNGMVNAGGIHGIRELKGDYMFGLLGASTPLNQTAWNTMGKVGSRLIFLHAPARLSRGDRRQRALDQMTSKLHYKTRKKIVKDAVRDYVEFFFGRFKPPEYQYPENAPENLQSIPELQDHCGYLPRSVRWHRENDDPKILKFIALLAEFLTRCRSDVKTWTEKGEDGSSETNSSGVVEEGVDRFTAVIYNLSRCHALVSGRNGITEDDLQLAIAVTMSSLPDDRRKGVELLIDADNPIKESDPGEFTISELKNSMSYSDKTAKVIMKKLDILDIGNFVEGAGSTASKFQLHDDYAWFTTDEFRKFYRTWDNHRNGIQNEEIPF